MLACPCSPPDPMTAPAFPTRCRLPPIHGDPNPILKAHRTHTISVRQNALKTIIIVLTAHLRWTIPPYRTASAGMLIRPTSVAAVICQALSPLDSQLA